MEKPRKPKWIRVDVRLHPAEARKLDVLSKMYGCRGKAAIIRQVVEWTLDQRETLEMLAGGKVKD